MQKVWEHFNDRVTLEVIPGGMIRGASVGPLSDKAPYIQDAYKTVESYTGVLFGQAYLDELFGEATSIQDSEPGCLAQTVISKHYPDKALVFAHALQIAIYREGMAPTDQIGIASIAEKLGVDMNHYNRVIQEDETYQEMVNYFNRSEGMSVNGFPTLFLEIEDQRFVISQGFTSFHTIKDRISSILSENAPRR